MNRSTASPSPAEPRDALPEVAVRLWVDAGRMREALPGVGALTGACLDEGTAGRSGTEIADGLASIGAHVACGGGGVTARCLSADLPTVMGVVADVALRPDFPEDSIEQRRGQLIAQVRADADDPATTGRLRLRRELYADHPLGRPANGGEPELTALAHEDLVAHHATLFVPRNAILTIVRDVDVEATLALARATLGAWEDRPQLHPR